MSFTESFIRNNQNVPDEIKDNLINIVNIINRYERLWAYFPDGKSRHQLKQVEAAFLRLTEDVGNANDAANIPFATRFLYLSEKGKIPSDVQYIVIPTADKLDKLSNTYKNEFGSCTKEQVIVDRQSVKDNLLEMVNYCINELQNREQGN